MKRSTKSIAIMLLLILALAIPVTALAGKRVYKANLSAAAELHEVIGSSAKGSAVFTNNQSGSMSFMVSVRGLSGDVGGVHIHAPADATQTAPVLLTLCGSPSPAAVSSCTVTDGYLYIEGTLSSSFLAQSGVSASTLYANLDAGTAYINVHTELNPAGETRGQILPH